MISNDLDERLVVVVGILPLCSAEEEAAEDVTCLVGFLHLPKEGRKVVGKALGDLLFHKAGHISPAMGPPENGGSGENIL